MITLIKHRAGHPKTHESRYFPRWKGIGKATKTQMAEEMARNSTFSKGEVEGIMTDFAQKICDELLNGKTVEVQGLGTFTLNVSGKAQANAKDVTTEGLKVSVRFKPDVSLQVRLKAESEFQFISK